MLFNSTEFLIFLAAFVLAYAWLHANLRHRNLLIVSASYLFYGWWDWRFLGLLALSSLVDFRVGIALGSAETHARRRRWIGLSLVFNLGLLAIFKYFGFFLESFQVVLAALGASSPSPTWNIVLPVGISFYTFQSLGYTIDVYRGRIAPCRDLGSFLAFVAFFPQLVAGPIERATHLLPQFQTPRTLRLDDLERGFWLVLWGLFKKVVVADNLAPFVELAFDHGISSGPLLVLGTLAFAGQIYGDFSGYSDIARGIAAGLGFDLMRNFDRPYSATTVQEFWRRWHVSLSTWFRDYVYVPLGGNRGSEARTCRNLALTFLLAGLWHGAGWNFVLWGVWHGGILVLLRLWHRTRTSDFHRDGLPRRILARLATLSAIGYGWVLFRSTAPGTLARVHQALVNWSAPEWIFDVALGVGVWSLPLVLAESTYGHRLMTRVASPRPGNPAGAQVIRASIAGFGILAIAAYWQRESVPFLYFQF